ncbi:MAG: hypothetical protein AAF550_04920, partial [Myxococcota bacterium]
MIALLLGMGLSFAQVTPSIEAETLSGDKVALPGSLSSAQTILVLSFERGHQSASNDWRPHLAKLAKGGSVDWLELAFLDVSTPMQLVIGTAMSAGITDEVARKHVAPVWSSADAVVKAFGIAKQDQVALVVVDAKGKMTFKQSGEPSADKVAALT